MNFVKFYKKYGIYVFLCVVFAFFAISSPTFLSAYNIMNILRQASMLGIVVIGVTIVMIGGGMDLSVGMQMAVDGMLCGVMLVNLHFPVALSVILTIIIGCIMGVLNGAIAIKLNVAAIIVTLGTMLILQGVAYLITGGYPITDLPRGIVPIGQGYIGPVPIPAIIFIVFSILGWVIMNKTYLGRHIYAIGGNKEAAKLAGIPVEKINVLVYMFSGFAASIAAVIMIARTNGAQPGAGSTYAFDCMTAACLGGVSINGGEGNIAGAIIGVIILGILDNGLVLMGVNSNWQNVIKGAVLLFAVAIDGYRGKGKRKVKKA